MSLVYQIPRKALWWLLIAQAAVILPLLQHLPSWLILVWTVCVAWRVQIVRGVYDAPKAMVKVPLALSMVVALIMSFGKLFALEPLVALLLLTFLLKLLELQSQRDVLLLLLLGFFVGSTQLLFSTSILAFLYAVFSFTLLLSAFMALHTATESKSLWQSLKKSSLIILQAVPLAVLMFFIMPRIGSLWTVPLSSGAGKTGFSDSMAPGNISQLNKDYSPAFRVDFADKKSPPQRELYWRGISLSAFDGRRWEISPQDRDPRHRYRRLRQQQQRFTQQWQEDFTNYRQQQGVPYVDYELMMEPSFQPWLFSMATAQVALKDVVSTNDYLFLRDSPVAQRLLYRVRSYPQFLREPEDLSRGQNFVNTQLPRGFNPRTRELVESWRQEGSSDRQIIARALRWFQGEFTYSLQDTSLAAENPVDDFLFNRQRGYCEHFSSAFVVMMRAADIPARVVLGYQGGQWNDDEKYLLVTQADAHAWAEVWLPDTGWQRVDPTNAVAPERIELGFREYIEQASAASETNGFAELRQAPWLAQMQMRLDALNYSWQSWVLSYDQEQQLIFFQKVLGGDEHWRIVAALMASATLVLAILGLWLWWRARPLPPPPELLPWLQLEQKLQRAGWQRNPAETAQQFAERIAAEKPELAGILKRYTQLAYKLLYLPANTEQQDAIVQQLRRLRNSLRL
ncbi:transglutaminase TgpA family protein [Pseudoteredinibacter isoporae]|uniref:Transglutaminase-like putative cysteine protease n=1 Tax=Pseudoteredinibacter isoporae TaxID=570281 RepID=A0A7X0MXL1_9GAMM|nr:DUF3488 and transglutaminase-like domain-containing protein [Pseudoteredinibacter isoporae]MBB6523350.1 transglutaminase-like putative cysteine protease [Pseudoteredinibacter isoporae]NHO88863.1 DUF3488 domain-containing transglutaminase family protein [Pseudoteredinibacter isoporae]NIB24429.1 DUF3488 domain-containing transglutaminase family protein [Pseudoteredinibacter isoporae]